MSSRSFRFPVRLRFGKIHLSPLSSNKIIPMQKPFLSPRTKYSRELKAKLIRENGGKCARCPRTDFLQFDCIVSQGKEHHAFNYRQRLKFYEGEASRKNLQLLCPDCHVQKTLDEIAARHFHNAVVTCPNCARTIRVSDQLRQPTPPPVVSSLFVVPGEFLCDGTKSGNPVSLT